MLDGDKYRCDNCQRLLGRLGGAIDLSAGWVLGRAKLRNGVQCGGGRGCRPIYEHPLACSDACEDRLLETWPVAPADAVWAEDWGPDFRDADVAGTGA